MSEAIPVRRSYRARWILPVCGEPIENGTFEIEAGRITALHDRADPAAHDLGNALIIPGLVNAHTHLEFSDLDSPLSPAEPFPDWIRALVGYRASRTDEQLRAAVIAGHQQATNSGTTAIGEIATPQWSAESFAGEGSQVVAYLELLGLSADRHDPQLQLAREHLTGGENDPPHLKRGLGPHAPYSVRMPLYAALVELAAEFRVPLAIHLAETQAEMELLQSGTGEFVELLREFGVWDDGAIPRGTRPLDFLRPLAVLETAAVIHGNYLADEEIDFLAANPQIHVVYCPRTHAYFGHRNHPWKKLLERGASVALGTDGRGSNPDLSLLREMQYLAHKHPDCDPAKIVEAGTLAGARTLGLDADIGTLQAGKRADIAVIVPDAAAGNDPYEMLLANKSCTIRTMLGGRWLTNAG